MTTQRILVTDTLADSGLQILRAASDVELDYRPGLKGKELLQAVAQSDALITRSGTAVTAELVNAGTRLRIIGRAGVGLDNVDVDACTARGILVINAPTANILSATEHTMAMLLALCRNIPEAHASVKRGEWNRSKFLGIELSGKVLGIIGLGRIGTRVTTRARAFGMRVIAYDPYIAQTVGEKVGADMMSLDELFAEADVITVHTPLSDETRGMIGPNEIAKMKDGVILVNCARGGIYEENALAAALESGKVSGAAIDVYEKEPPGKDHPLLKAKNIILSPHIGANTIEAQDRVAVQTAEMVVDALRGSIFVSAVNLPFEGLADADAAPLISLAEKLGLFGAQIMNGPDHARGDRAVGHRRAPAQDHVGGVAQRRADPATRGIRQLRQRRADRAEPRHRHQRHDPSDPARLHQSDHLPRHVGARRDLRFGDAFQREESADRLRQQLPRRVQARRASDLHHQQGRPRRRRQGRHAPGRPGNQHR